MDVIKAGKPARAGAQLIRLLALAAMLSLGVLGAASLAAPAATSISFAPTDDAEANSEAPASTHGTLPEGRVDGSPIRRTYVRFDVSGLTAPVSRATLRIYSRTAHSTGFDVRSTATDWTEALLTYNNAPAPSATVTGASGSITAGTWEAIDVTALVTGNGAVAFALTTTSETNLPLAMKESGANAPQLVVETTASSTAATSTSPTTTAPPPTTTTATTTTATTTTATTTTATTTTATTTTATTTTATTTTAPPPSDDPVVAVAGDIAGDGSGDSATAAILDSLGPTAVLTAGDNAYPSGTASQYSSFYDPTWGRHKAITYPTPGNHEYQTKGASGYFGYFGSRAGASGEGYYSFDLGAWHLIALNSEISHGATSTQVTWLKNDLAATGAPCVLAYWHKPRFTAGNYGDTSEFQPFWDALYAANADVVINGHDHNYQRYVPLNPSGARDGARGLREFVVGTGGRSHYAIRTDSRRESADGGTYGVLKLTLRATGYDWQFIPEAGKTFTDSGSGSCH
jgi:calcineurin-like phosphoesterase family protein